MKNAVAGTVVHACSGWCALRAWYRGGPSKAEPSSIPCVGTARARPSGDGKLVPLRGYSGARCPVHVRSLPGWSGRGPAPAARTPLFKRAFSAISARIGLKPCDSHSHTRDTRRDKVRLADSAGLGLRGAGPAGSVLHGTHQYQHAKRSVTAPQQLSQRAPQARWRRASALGGAWRRRVASATARWAPVRRPPPAAQPSTVRHRRTATGARSNDTSTTSKHRTNTNNTPTGI